MYQNLKEKAKKRQSDSISASYHTGYTPFIILGQMRTGSTWLSTILNCSPQVYIEREIFNKSRRNFGGDFDLICANLLRCHPISVKAVGCKIFYTHLTDEEWQKFQALREFKIIHLLRQNRLRSYLSLQIARKTNYWLENKSDTKPPLEHRRVHIDKGKLLAYIRLINFQEEQARQRFRAREVIEINYEDLVANFHSNIWSVLAFLGATEWNGQDINLQKQNPEPLCDLIANFEKLEKTFRNTPCHIYFEEE